MSLREDWRLNDGLFGFDEGWRLFRELFYRGGNVK